MNINKDYYFEIGLSVNCYNSKEETKLCLSSIGAKSANMDKLAFYNHTTISMDEFEFYATNGYAFCNLFNYDANRKYYRENTNPKFQFRYVYEYPEYKNGNNKGAMKLQFKSDDFFEGSQCVFVDIDYTKYETMNEYVDVLEMKPTFCYCTYSDKIKGTRKFRLCYIFDSILDEFEFCKVSKAITKMVEDSTGEEMIDDCGTRESQYFNGTTNKEETFRSDYIYSYSDFIKEEDNITIDNNKSDITFINPFASSTTITTIYDDRQNGTVEVIEEKKPELDLNFVSDMERLDYEEFMHYYSKQYKYYWRVDNGNWINGKIQIVDEDYFALYYNVDRLKDGMCRKKKLYQRMCLRRVMNPDATPNEILFNSYVDLAKFIDNTEDVITIQDLVRNVNSCFRFTVEEIIDKFSNMISVAKEKTTPKNGKIYKNKQSIQDGNFSLIDLHFDVTKSPNENLQVLKDNGIIVSEKTIYRYINKKYPKPTDEEIYQMLDLNLSLRENEKMLYDSYNIKVSKNKINKIIKNH